MVRVSGFDHRSPILVDIKGLRRDMAASPYPLVEVIPDRVNGGLHDSDCPTDNKAATQGVGHSKGNGEVHNCKADGLGHETDLAVSYINDFRISLENYSHIWFCR